ncbi:hypothetical protein Tco_1477916 [Tanacetum coccineum]
MVSGNNYTRVNYNYFAKKAHPGAYRNILPRVVLMKTGLRPLNTARPVNTAHPKTTVYSARPMSCFSKSAQSTVKRPYSIKTALTNKNYSQKVNTAKGSFYTARPKVVNTTRPNSAVVNALKVNQVNAVKDSAYWVWRPTKLNSASITFKRHNFVDARGTCSISQTSRNLMEGMLPLGEEPKDEELLVQKKVMDASNYEPQPSNDAEKKDDEGGIDDQERTKNSAQDVNTVGPSINTASTNFNTELDLSNISTTYPVPTTPNIRIHKDHSLDRVLGDVQSGVQIRRMINKQGFISAVYEGKTHEDLHTCLFACFLSQEEPKKIIQALKDPS